MSDTHSYDNPSSNSNDATSVDAPAPHESSSNVSLANESSANVSSDVSSGEASFDKGRVLAFDFGINHIGVAVGNEEVGSAQSLNALKANNGTPNENDLSKLFSEWKPEYIVVGMPMNMDGTPELIGRRARKFGHRLMSKFLVPVYFKDERLTSTAAKEQIFNYQGGYRALVKDKGRIDAVAAKLILEGFFDAGGRNASFDVSFPTFAKKKK